MEIRYKNYKEYLDYQIKLNQSKINNIWVDDEELILVSDHIKKNIDHKKLSLGICHGSRNGYEVKKLRELLKTEVIGTDISTTATNFSHMILHDFHELNKNWINKCDFIYTNSLDHSYNPYKFLQNNYLHLKNNSFLYIEHSNYHIRATDYGDCFGATKEEYIALISNFYLIVDELKVLSKKGIEQNRTIIVGYKK